MTKNPRRLLDLVVPFRFLSSTEKDRLTAELDCIEAIPLEDLFSQGDDSTGIYLLEEGQVELIYQDSPFVKPSNLVRAGHYFGERAALLQQRRVNGARAVTKVRCWVLAGERLLELIRANAVFAQAFGTILRDKHGIFLPLEDFSAEVARSLAQGGFNLPRLIELYRTLEPALHPGLANLDALDVEAFSYAIRRLPDNLTTTFAWYFTDDIPALYASPSELFPEIATVARRRDVWEMLPGKNMVLLRNGLSDILDFLTNLCLYSIEAQKIRRRLHDPLLLLKLVQQRDAGQVAGDLPFSDAECNGLKTLWGNKMLERLVQIVFHHEDLAIQVERQLNNYNSRRSEKWANQVSRAIKDLTDVDPWEFPDDWEVHIVSSNTHSVTNCLSPWPRRLEAEVLAWAEATRHPFLAAVWENPRDKLYALLADFFVAHPERVAKPEDERDWGILRLDDQSTTGIAVQLIDTAALGYDKGTRKFLVNIDYAFGEQAEEIIYNLITLFHKHIRSVNVLGKAGSLVGKRGDILVPTAFVLQSDDAFHPLPAPPPLDGLAARLRRSEIHVGPLLTVEGTLLQNRPLLHFYRNLWKCIGLEMEGVYYSRKVTDCIQLGVLDPAVVQRYFYYVSDVPLQAGERLSAPLLPAEGIPPLYAITREILGAILPNFRD
ncbi:MAG: cyclic nucleotide-binding domain-containing protein [Spirochaetales bacterium]